MKSADVAIVGYAARLPGAETAAEVWSVLHEGRCTVTELDSDRFTRDRFLDPKPGILGKSYSFHAGILSDVFGFDGEDFGISPREARQMDPQQRLLLENVAHAFDHAGMNPESVSGERTGVFVGASSADHSTFALQDPRQIEGHFMLGNTLSIFANRISHQWDFRGPSLTIDTACSSGLYALHLGAEEIRRGTIDTAVVAGVNLLLSPVPFIGFSHAGMLSPDGFCRPFSAHANGYVRSEGVVTFILRNGEAAADSGERARSLVLASATGNDGAKAGITVPSARRQGALLDQTLRRVHLAPDDIAFFEAHGTGTPVGDPIEAMAIGRSYGADRKSPLPIGSAKGNFGHLEPVSGLVGALKAQLALEHGVIPATLHAEELNPNIDFEALNLDVVRTARPIEGEGQTVAAINSFGFGGANAHAILARPLQADEAPKSLNKALPALRLSASSENALKGLVSTWTRRLTSEEVTPDSIRNANHRTRVRPLQLCVPPGTASEMAQTLDTWIKGQPSPSVVGRRLGRNLRVAFVFGGNGSVWPGMARAIYRDDPAFRRSFQRVSRVLNALAGIDLCKLLMSEELDQKLGDAQTDQLLLFAVQVALVSALKAKGLVASATLGHSVGEVAAAVVSGGLSLEAGARIILSRSRSLEVLRGAGTMAALSLSQEKTETLLAELGSKAEIGAVNSEEGVTISGATVDVESVLKAARGRRIAGRRLKVDYPYHSSAVDVLEPELMDDLAHLTCRVPTLDLYSAWSGRLVSRPPDADYWWNNVRQPVLFRDAMRAMCEDGYQIFIEISPQPVLQAYIADALDRHGQAGAALPSLVRDDRRDATTIALDALARGAALKSDTLLGVNVPISCELPLYPFNRAEHRLQYDGQNVLGPNGDYHALLGARVIEGGNEWRSEISATALPWLADHKVQGRTVLPATAIIEMLSEAARQGLGIDRTSLDNIEFLRPVFLPDEGPAILRVVLETGLKKLTLAVRQQDAWLTCASARAGRMETVHRERILLDWGDNPTALYRILNEVGLHYGEAFRLIRSVSQKDRQIDVRLAPGQNGAAFRFDPTSADAALHALVQLLPDALRSSSNVLLPARVDRWQQVSDGVISGARLDVRDTGGSQLAVDVAYVDGDGKILAEMSGLRLRQARVSNEPKPQFWCEERVLVARAKSAEAVSYFRRRTSRVPEKATDIEVLRDALGRRMAWDALKDDPSKANKDFADIIRSGLGPDATLNDAVCPWPERDTLVELLMDVAPAASDELHGALRGAARAIDAPTVGNSVIGAAFSLLSSPTLAHSRVAILGQVTPGLAKMLMRETATLSIIATDAAQLDALELQFQDGRRPSIRLLTDIRDSHPFDVLLAIGGSRQLSGVDAKPLMESLAADGVILAVDELDDAFGVMTGRHNSLASLDRIRLALTRAGARVQTRVVAEYPAVRILIAERPFKHESAPPRLDVSGDAPLAFALRGVCTEDRIARRVRVIPGSNSADERTRSLWKVFSELTPNDGTVWIVQEGADLASVLHGWRRASINEADIDIRTASVEAGSDPEFVARTLEETSEQELVFEAGGAYAPRVRRAEVQGSGGARLVLEKDGGTGLGRVTWRPVSRQKPIDDEIEVRVEAAGLNFRDVMWAGDLLPYDAVHGGYAGATLGMECAGRVARVGPNSTLAVGERVALVAPAAFSTHVTARSAAAIPLTADVSIEAAACLPVAFATALYALENLANLKSGESILIHAATGGVGLAALRLALRTGARVLASAGTPEKRRLLRLLGVTDVFDSRSLDFARGVMEATGGQGVDVVLNSLSGEAMEASLHCLAPFGRFLELGKRDYFADTPLPLRVFRNNISYFGVDLDQILKFRPDLAERLFSRLCELMKAGEIKPLPHCIFEADGVAEAFEKLKRAEHIGKIAVRPPKPGKAPVQAQQFPVRGTWLVVGGTSGFGLKTAEWLARRGAERLWLVSRTGQIAPEAMADLKSMAEIRVRVCDVVDKELVCRLVDEIQATDGTLNGLVHAAMVLRDKPFRDLDQEDVDAVVRPKVAGAENLDQATRSFDIEHFWLFGSVVARFGSFGQAPYVAANMALEDIAVHRAAQGLPALTIAWGPILDAGYLAREHEVRRSIEKQFDGRLTASSALSKLGEFLDSGCKWPTVTIATSPRPASALRSLSGPLMSEFSQSSVLTEGGAVDGLIKLLDQGKDDEARDLLLDLMRTEAARVARSDREAIDVSRPLNEIGFDSLMGVNLLLEIEKQLGSSLAMLDGSVDLSIQKLANRILPALQKQGHGLAAEMATRHISNTVLSASEIDKIIETSERVDGRP